jgi:hypothetical protein
MSRYEKPDLDKCGSKTIIFINVEGMNVSINYALINENVPFVKIPKYFIDHFLDTTISLLSELDKMYIIKCLG